MLSKNRPKSFQQEQRFHDQKDRSFCSVECECVFVCVCDTDTWTSLNPALSSRIAHSASNKAITPAYLRGRAPCRLTLLVLVEHQPCRHELFPTRLHAPMSRGALLLSDEQQQPHAQPGRGASWKSRPSRLLLRRVLWRLPEPCVRQCPTIRTTMSRATNSPATGSPPPEHHGLAQFRQGAAEQVGCRQRDAVPCRPYVRGVCVRSLSFTACCCRQAGG